MPTFNSNTSETNAPAQADSDWPQLLEQWKQAQRTFLLRPLSRVSAAIVVGTGILLLMAAILIPVLLRTLFGADPNSLPPLAIMGTLGAMGAGLIMSQALGDLPLTAAQKALVQRMEVMSDTRAVGLVLELLPDAATRRERNVLQTVLTRLLPLLRPDDAPALSAEQRNILYDAITTHTAEHDNAFFLACMDAVAQVGDVNALVPLTRVILADAPTQAQQVARDKARQTRDTLLARLDFGTVGVVPAWLDQLPAQVTLTPPHLEQVLVPMYALSRLLRRLTPADVSLLTPRNRQTLTWAHRLVPSLFVSQSARGGALGVDEAKMGRLGPDFELAVLDALAQVGTGNDAAHVQTLLNDGSTAYARAVRAKAREVLPLLEARREKEQMGRTLLRGSAAPPTAQDQLLRPASDAYNTQNARPDELLRPRPVTPPAPPIQTTTVQSDEDQQANITRHT